MSSLQEVVHREMVRSLVSQSITCPRTGEVLDVRTCVVLLDRDGDPARVVSQHGWSMIDEPTRTLLQKAHGLTVDPATVRRS